MPAAVRLLITALDPPHLDARLDRLLEQLVALGRGRERQPEPVSLLGIIARADAEHGAAA